MPALRGVSVRDRWLELPRMRRAAHVVKAVRLALFWTRAKDAARDFYHVRNPGVWETLGMLF